MLNIDAFINVNKTVFQLIFMHTWLFFDFSLKEDTGTDCFTKIMIYRHAGILFSN